MRKLMYQPPNTQMVGVLLGQMCNGCNEMKQAVGAFGVQGSMFFYICTDCAKQIQRIIKSHGPLPDQEATATAHVISGTAATTSSSAGTTGTVTHF